MRFVSDRTIREWVGGTVSGRIRIAPLSQGLLNQNVLIEAGGTKFLLKAYRPEMTREKAEDMHRLMAHVARRGVPVSLPVATYAGEDAGPVAALYPFVEGAHLPPYGMGTRRAAMLGDMLGTIDRALDSFRPRAPKPSSLAIASWDPDKALREIGEIRASVRRKPEAVRRVVEDTLDTQERMILEGDWDTRRFAKLPVRVCHADYHIKNILVRDGRVAVVLDWEKAGWDWRGFEVMRSVMFNCRRASGSFCWDDVRAYLSGYARHARLNDLERALAFDCGFFRAAFSLWAVKQFVAGRTEIRDHVVRRVRLSSYLFKHRSDFSGRIERMLADAQVDE